VGGDELLFIDEISRQQPFVCIITAPANQVGLSISGHLVAQAVPAPLLAEKPEDLTPQLILHTAAASPHSDQLARLADIVPWFAQNALIHYLSPRGLEQFSGGGWGTRDVCQGPVELLLALGRVDAIRDLLVRVMGNQNPDGDWPQWFMFFERERGIRAGDSHGDIVFWPLVVLAQYLTASGDAALLDETVPFFDARGTDVGERATVWEHVERALALISKRVIPGTTLAAYGHGDWNDSLQPADPAMRERMCSAWTVTLHFQALVSLASVLRDLGRTPEAERFERSAQAIREDFQRLLVVDGVLTGYALFDDNKHPRYLLHPSDQTTGVHYSSLAMIHAILEDLLTPAQSKEHLKLIEQHLSTPDGVRLFDRPMPYHGGLQKLFQRAETATYFGREIGLMYTHAHLRYAQALAHVGEAERFFHALCQANPIGIRSIVPTATLRQSNCYYSSSDAAFEDRYQASEEYQRIARGSIALDGGWRVYSSGAGIALGLIVRRFLGVSPEARVLRVDPVIPAALDGLRVETTLLGRPVELRYQVKGAGCGVNAVSLNETALTFDIEANPHRRGAALVAMAAISKLLQAAGNVLRIDIG
jgi:cellobiose phosphorylase